MHIREAAHDDNHELQELQAKCPMGTTLILTTVNTPDFFARAKASLMQACSGLPMAVWQNYEGLSHRL